MKDTCTDSQLLGQETKRKITFSIGSKSTEQKCGRVRAWSYFYICGDKQYMARIHRALIDIAIEHGGMSKADATHFIEDNDEGTEALLERRLLICISFGWCRNRYCGVIFSHDIIIVVHFDFGPGMRLDEWHVPAFVTQCG